MDPSIYEGGKIRRNGDMKGNIKDDGEGR